MKKNDEISVYISNPTTVSKFENSFFGETLIGISFYFACLLAMFCIYYFVCGHGIGSLLHYALADTLAMPITYETCVNVGLIPGVNILGFFLAAYILMWRFLIFLGLKALIWLLGWLPEFLRAWANNI